MVTEGVAEDSVVADEEAFVYESAVCRGKLMDNALEHRPKRQAVLNNHILVANAMQWEL